MLLDLCMAARATWHQHIHYRAAHIYRGNTPEKDRAQFRMHCSVKSSIRSLRFIMLTAWDADLEWKLRLHICLHTGGPGQQTNTITIVRVYNSWSTHGASWGDGIGYVPVNPVYGIVWTTAAAREYNSCLGGRLFSFSHEHVLRQNPAPVPWDSVEFRCCGCCGAVACLVGWVFLFECSTCLCVDIIMRTSREFSVSVEESTVDVRTHTTISPPTPLMFSLSLSVCVSVRVDRIQHWTYNIQHSLVSI